MPGHHEQIPAVIALLRHVLDNDLLAVYLHGSAVSGQLQPRSDIDLIAIVDGHVTDDQRHQLVRSLLRISGRHPAEPGGLRCVEVIVFSKADIARAIFPARAELVFGEWLRKAFEAGENAKPSHDAEHTLMLAQARREAVPLVGPDVAATLPDISEKTVRRAIGEMLPALLAGLHGDETNGLLTLARMWHTMTTGEFVSKDQAASWAIPRLPERDGQILEQARRTYLGDAPDDWNGRIYAARQLAVHMNEHINRLL